ncbi:MAG: threonine-phosphate decarboxylase CobD [Hyphomicrobium sp.]|nr:threonine-phosphate decarboxylase [Hyphomicrobium sp.]
MRDHGGNIDQAIEAFGGQVADWIDLSTGINRTPYPVPQIEDACWRALPTAADRLLLHEAARNAYGTNAAILATAGAQAAIQMIPRMRTPGHARVLSPTYNEHAASLRACGWQVSEVTELGQLGGADMAVVVNPNNPDGRRYEPRDLLALLDRTGRLIVDESFADPYTDISVAKFAGRPGLLVLRSFGKFYGLAGVRLGFAIGSAADIDALSSQAGPWPVSGPAIQIGKTALADSAWSKSASLRLEAGAQRLDDMAQSVGWKLAGGTLLFRLYETPDAHNAQKGLAHNYIWSRTFPWSKTWLRLGLPGPTSEWERLSAAFARLA